MAAENGENFVKNLAIFIRTHEKALANALQLRKNVSRERSPSTLASPDATQTSFLASAQSAGVSGLAAALSFGTLQFSPAVKPAKLTLTPHHLFYLLSRFEDFDIDVGPMNIRLENINSEGAPNNYVSFLNSNPKPNGRSGKDSDSIHSVSSVRSVMSNMSSFWSGFSLGSGSSAKSEKAKAALEADTKYLYSAFTKVPCLRLSQDRRARLISGYEEFPFDTAVPLLAFKNIGSLEIYDTDFRQFYGWDRMAEQLRSLTIKRGHVEDLRDLLISIVIDDIERRRRRSSKHQNSPSPLWSSSPCIRQTDTTFGTSPISPGASFSPRRSVSYLNGSFDMSVAKSSPRKRDQSLSPTRPKTSRANTSYRKAKAYEMKRSGSGSSDSSTKSAGHAARIRSSSNLLAMGILPASKWRFLRHISLADNGLTAIASNSLTPLAAGLVSMDLSSNLFVEMPEGLAILTALKALNLSNCMIASLKSLSSNPLPAVESLNLRGNRLASLIGLDKVHSLERLDVRENRLVDPAELARLTGAPSIRDFYVAGNPFTKTHSNYRIQIFNIFRGAPGYVEDVRIDGTGPSYSERRQLRVRVQEPVAVLDSQKSHLVCDEVPVIRHSSVSSQPHLSEASGVPNGEGGTGKLMKRRPAQRTRLVDLAADPMQAATQYEALAVRPLMSENERSKSATPDMISSGEVPSMATSLRTPSDTISTNTDGASSVVEVQDLLLTRSLLSGNEYRHKIEALKHEYRGDWLRQLSEDARELRVHPPILHQSPLQQTSIPHGTPSLKQGIGEGSRILG